MGRSTTIRVFGFGLVALSLGAVACAAGDDGEGGGNNGTGGLVNGATGGVTGATGGVTGATGGVTGATGGTTGATGGTTAGTGGSTANPGSYPGTATPTTMTIAGGHVTSGEWAGYAYTWKGAMGAAGDTVNPASFETETANLCVWGSLGLSYDSVLAFGMATNQASGAMVKEGWTVAGTGLAYNVVNDGGTPLRVYVNVGEVSYCADITSATGTVPWGDFGTECWAPAGATNVALELGASITDVGVTAPGDEMMARSPAFCVVSLAPAP